MAWIHVFRLLRWRPLVTKPGTGSVEPLSVYTKMAPFRLLMAKPGLNAVKSYTATSEKRPWLSLKTPGARHGLAMEGYRYYRFMGRPLSVCVGARV